MPQRQYLPSMQLWLQSLQRSLSLIIKHTYFIIFTLIFYILPKPSSAINQHILTLMIFSGLSQGYLKININNHSISPTDRELIVESKLHKLSLGQSNNLLLLTVVLGQAMLLLLQLQYLTI